MPSKPSARLGVAIRPFTGSDGGTARLAELRRRRRADITDRGIGPGQGLVQTLPGRRVVTSWTIHTFPSGSLKEQNDP